MHILILGGTTEASALANRLPNRRVTLSLAGRTRYPMLPRAECRIGGFGGVEGLAAWLHENHVTALVDATHPFARIMPFNAAQAAAKAGAPLIKLSRPAWEVETGWTEVTGHAGAIATLGAARARVFLTVGRLEVPAYAATRQHFYLVRSIDPVEPKPLPDAVWLEERGPFTEEHERRLLTKHAIDTLITKNSGGEATRAKLIAARALRLPVILIERPPLPEVRCVHRVDETLAWLSAIHGVSL